MLEDRGTTRRHEVICEGVPSVILLWWDREEGKELFFLCKEIMSYKRMKKQRWRNQECMEGNHKDRWKGGGKQRSKQGKKEAKNDAWMKGMWHTWRRYRRTLQGKEGLEGYKDKCKERTKGRRYRTKWGESVEGIQLLKKQGKVSPKETRKQWKKVEKKGEKDTCLKGPKGA